MKAEDIRNMELSSCFDPTFITEELLREIAAQLAELNANIRQAGGLIAVALDKSDPR